MELFQRRLARVDRADRNGRVASYLLGRSALPGRLRLILDRRPVQVAGRFVLMALVLAMAIRLAVVAAEIIRL